MCTIKYSNVSGQFSDSYDLIFSYCTLPFFSIFIHLIAPASMLTSRVPPSFQQGSLRRLRAGICPRCALKGQWVRRGWFTFSRNGHFAQND